eukprot:g36454.t1
MNEPEDEVEPRSDAALSQHDPMLLEREVKTVHMMTHGTEFGSQDVARAAVRGILNIVEIPLILEGFKARGMKLELESYGVFCEAVTQSTVRFPSVEDTTSWSISDSSLPFLDICVSISGDRLANNIQYKPTNSRSYLDYTSSHLASCKHSILFSQFLH